MKAESNSIRVVVECVAIPVSTPFSEVGREPGLWKLVYTTSDYWQSQGTTSTSLAQMAWRRCFHAVPAASLLVATGSSAARAADKNSESGEISASKLSQTNSHSLRIRASSTGELHRDLPHMQHLRKQMRDLLEGSISASAAPPLGYPTLTHVRHCDSYTMGFDGYHKAPAWVYERYDGHGQHPRTPTLGDGSPLGAGAGPGTPHAANRKRSYFHSDGSLPPYLQVQPNVYYGSGLDRGHMAPAAGHKFSQWGMDDTFRMSNIAPQVGQGFNRDYWARLEGHLRRLSKRHGATVHVFSGPVFTPTPMLAPLDNGGNSGNSGGGTDSDAPPSQAVLVAASSSAAETHRRMQQLYSPDGMKPDAALWWTVHPWLGKGRQGGLTAVPNGFYKVVLVENLPGEAEGSKSKGRPRYHVAAFLLPNARIGQDTPLSDFVVPLSALQAAVGFEFFPAVDCVAIEGMDACLLAGGAGQFSEGGSPGSPTAQISLLGGVSVKHLCTAEGGCQLPQPNWWQKKSKGVAK